jgi:hypothetical protein
MSSLDGRLKPTYGLVDPCLILPTCTRLTHVLQLAAEEDATGSYTRVRHTASSNIHVWAWWLVVIRTQTAESIATLWTDAVPCRVPTRCCNTLEATWWGHAKSLL